MRPPFARLLAGAAIAALPVLASCSADRVRVLERTRTEAFDLYTQGENAERLGQHQKALDLYLAALDRNQRPAFYFRAGRMHRLMGNQERALSFYDQALALAPDFELAQAERELARLELVEKGLAPREQHETASAPKIERPPEPSPEDLPKKLPAPKPTPESPETAAGRIATDFAIAATPPASKGAEGIRSEQVRKAVFPELQKPAGVDPGLLQKADKAAAAGQWNEAAQAYEAAVSADPGDTDLRMRLARAYLQTNRTRRAMEEFEAATRLRPADPEIAFRWGNALAETGDQLGAKSKYMKALDLEPGDVRILTNLGALLYTTGESEAALPYLETAVEVAPEYAPARLNLALVLLEARNDRAAAIGHLEAYLKLRGDRVEEVERWLSELRATD